MYIPTPSAQGTEFECLNEEKGISIFIKALLRMHVLESQIISVVFSKF